MKKTRNCIALLLLLAIVLCSAPLFGSIQGSASITGQQKTDFGLSFNSRGKFRIMQLADIQDYYSVQQGTLDTIQKAVALYKPDLLVLTGDNICGSGSESKFRQTVEQLKTVFGDTPFAVAFGNHDSESGPNRTSQYNIYKEYGALDFDNNFSSTDLGGVGTGCIPIRSSDGSGVAWNVVLIDSGTYDDNGGYGKPGYNDTSPYNNEAGYNGVVSWFSSMNEDMRSYTTDGDYAPTLSFQHIALREMYYAGILVSTSSGGITAASNTGFSGQYKLNPDNPTVTGLFNEPPCSSHSDTLALYKAIADKGNVKGIFYGHDHKNTFMGEGTINADGRDYTLVQGYCKATTLQSYNDGDPGVRVFELNENTGEYETFMSTLSQLNTVTQYYNSNVTGDCIYELGTSYSRGSDESARGYLTNRGYTLLAKDLNENCSSASYIYMGYKKQAGSSNAITAVRFFKTTSSTDKPETITSSVNGRVCTFHIVDTGEDVRLNLNLNNQANGTVGSYYIYTYYTTDPVALPIDDIVIDTNSSLSGYTTATWFDEPTTAADLNKGCGSSSDYIYLHYKSTGENVTSYVNDLQTAYEDAAAVYEAGQGSASNEAWSAFTAKYTEVENAVNSYAAPLYAAAFSPVQLRRLAADVTYASSLPEEKGAAAYFYYPAGSTFYSPLASAYSRYSADAAKAFLTDDAYTVLDYNLNEGCNCGNQEADGGVWAYLGYKTTADISSALKAVRFYRTTSSAYNSSSAGSITSSVAGTSTAFSAISHGVDPYLNLNRTISGATYGGQYIYGYESCDASLPAITDIVIDGNPVRSGYMTALWFDDTSSVANLNYGSADAAEVYVHYKSDAVDVTSQYNTLSTALSNAATDYAQPVGYYTTATRNALRTAYDTAAAIKAEYDANGASTSYNAQNMTDAANALNTARAALVRATTSYQTQADGEWLYGDLATGIANVYSGGTVRLISDATVTKKITITKDVTIASYGAARTIYRGFTGDDMFVVNGGTLTLPGTTSGYALTIDGLKSIYPSAGNSCVVFVVNNGTFNMCNGVTIKDSTRDEGSYIGAVLARLGTLNISGGSITGCTFSGVAIQSGATLNLSGGEITGNTAGYGYTGGVVAYSGSTLNLGGSARVTGNSNGNIFIGTGVVVNLIGTYTGNAGLTMQTPPTTEGAVTAVSASSGNAGAYVSRFTSDNSAYVLMAADGNINLAITADITYDYNDGSVVTVPGTAGVPVSLSSAGTSKTGYTFNGWYSDAECTSLVGMPGAAFVPTGNITLYADWTINTYNVRLELVGGSITGSTPTSAEYNSVIAIENIPTKAGHTFSGWSITGMDGVTHYYGASQGSFNETTASSVTTGADCKYFKNLRSTTGYVTITACWDEIVSVITLDGCGATSQTETSVSAEYGSVIPNVSVPERKYTVDIDYMAQGLANESRTAIYEFKGYYTAVTGGTPKISKTGIGTNWWGVEDVTYYAQWTAAAVELPSPVREGYDFGGWYADSACNTKVADGGASYTPTSNTTLYAKWTLKTYTVRFLNFDGTVLDTQTVSHGGDALPTAVPSKAYDSTDHYEFNGWSGYTNITSNTDITAQFTAVAHEYAEVITTQPTCTGNGLKTCTCSCGRVYTEIVTALGHDYISAVTAPTCTQEGFTTHTCSRCSVFYRDNTVAALGHTWNDGEVTTAATCTQDGVKTFTCSVCTETRTEAITATGHTVVNDAAVAPTCTETGLTAGTHCSVCEEVLVAQTETAALGHTWNDGEVTTAATCTEDGVKTYTCTVCTETRTEAITATGHTVVNDAAVAPTCTETGLTAGTHCSVCHETLTAQTVVAALGHDYKAVVTAPTCTEEGYTTYTCSRCDDTYTADETDALGHTWNDGEVTTAATCTEDGVKIYTCTVCTETRTEAITATGHTVVDDNAVAPTCTQTGLTAGTHCSVCHETLTAQTVVAALGHDYKSVVTAPTCTEDGYTTYTCSRCDDIYTADETDALGHTWNDGEVTTAASCTEDGVKTYTCTVCTEARTEAITATGHTVVNDAAVAPTCTQTGLTAGTHCSVCDTVLTAQTVIAALGHDYKSVVTAPTCTEDGYTTYTCSRCDDAYTADETTALGHTWNDGEVTTAATCTEDGVKTFTCEVCHTTRTEAIAATGHTAVDDAAVAPTCTETGLTAGTHCSVCHEILTAQTVVAALGHDYETVVTAPTCTEEGYTTYTCSRCDDTYTADETTALGHTWNDGEVTTAATCTEDGVKTYTCTVCTETRTEAIEATGHTVVDDNAVAPTCTETGLTAGTHCSVCHETLTAQTVVEALGHTWNDGEVTTAATCTEDGVKTYTCTVCTETRTEAITATGHTVVNDAAVAATCTQTGLTAGTHCSVCHETLTAQTVVEALGHTWNDGEVTTAATCTQNGVKTFTCTRCNETKTEVIASVGHTTVVDEAVAATCTATGLTEGSHCSVCDEVFTAQTAIPALGHDYKETVTAPTCTTAGYTSYTCTRCSDSYTENETAALGHAYNSVVTAPTCTAQGFTTHTCSRCARAYNDTPIAALGHSYTYNTVQPDCTHQGYTSYSCSVCADSGTKDATAALGHIDDNGDNICDRCEEDVNPEHSCSCDCHNNSFFTRIFWKLKVFFWKLFGVEERRHCSCGKSHW